MDLLLKSSTFFLLLTFIACQPSTTESDTETTSPQEETPQPVINLPKELASALEAHGGLERWQSMKTLEFEIERADSTEHHLIDLTNRKVLLSHPNYKLGFDGQDVWVSPNKEAFGKGSARFYHNLIFYFHAIPFVLADPGINYEILPQRELDGKTYDAVKISYNDGVGDAPDDYYIAHFDTETHLMKLLLYTVTYYSGESNDKYNALVYDEWEEVNGLLMPKLMKGYKFSEDQLGDLRYERPFENIKLSTEAPDQSLFEMPETAEIDPLRENI